VFVDVVLVVVAVVVVVLAVTDVTVVTVVTVDDTVDVTVEVAVLVSVVEAVVRTMEQMLAVSPTFKCHAIPVFISSTTDTQVDKAPLASEIGTTTK
jgi:hypothetical protein